jgi:hypothetical protein
VGQGGQPGQLLAVRRVAHPALTWYSRTACSAFSRAVRTISPA